ncbi:PREDICTED: armadillo repeat-containing protein 8-like, partial [Priapulus caudatus]|uniref:Armadillo repeat-containing protein 8-like n=1 Tax=Priapulus caudatus TaxID=37621 RepID=A0ABM1F4G8_PRICU
MHMEHDGNRPYMDKLFSQDQALCYEALVELKNSVIGSNKQKSNVILQGVVPRLMQFLLEDSTGIEFRLWHPNQQYVEACVRCLRSILMSPISPANVVYQDETIVPHMIALLPRSSTTKECVTSILADCCRTVDHQTILCNSGAIQVMAPLLQEDNYRVQMPTLKCYAAMCYQNPHVSQLITDAYYNGRYVTDSIVVLLSRDKTLHMQMAAAKCAMLINMAFQAEQKVKSSILVTLGTDQLFRLLADADVNVLMKTLGLLRNLLTTKPALCILANIADGNSAKEFVMSNEDVLKKITSYMMHSNVKLQIAATFCISNLIWNEEE